MKMFFQRLAPEFTHLSLSLVSCFEFTSRIATMDSIETISRFGKGLYSSTDGVTAGGRIFNNFLWSPLSWEPRGFLINTLMVSRKIIPWTACGPGSILNILALLLLSFQFWKIKEKRKEERMKGKIKKGGRRGVNEGSNGQYFLLPRERTKQPQQSGCLSTSLI